MPPLRRFDPARAAMAAAILEDLPQLFLAARNDRGKTLRTAAAEVGCGQATLARLERGTLPGGAVLLSILRWVSAR